MKRGRAHSILLAAAFAVLSTNNIFASSESAHFSRGFAVYNPNFASAHISTPAASQAYSSDFARFWEDLTSNVFEDICKAAELDLSQKANLPGDIIGIKLGYKRFMRRFPNSQLALVDEVILKPSLALEFPFTEQVNINFANALNISMNSYVEGRSQVVRPLESDRYCKELKTLIKLYNVKTAWPATVRRIDGMRLGEIWKLPLVFKITTGLKVSAQAYEAVEFSLGASQEKEFTPSVTLYKMAEDKLRLRVRIGSVKLKKLSASVSTLNIPVESLALWHADNFLAKFVNREIAKEINKALSIKFAFTKTHFQGKKIVFEFICNPKDKQQVELLSRFLKGDFGILKRLFELKLSLDSLSDEQTVAEEAAEVQQMAANTNNALHAAHSYAGVNHYDGNTTNINLQLPVVYKRDKEKRVEHNSYLSAETGDKLNVYKRKEKVRIKAINVPLLGSAVSRSREEITYIAQKDKADGTSTGPVFLYNRYDGGSKISASKAAKSLEKVNDILQYVGTRGEGLNALNTISRSDILPETVIKEDNTTAEPANMYRSVVSNFSLMINESGIQEIIFAPASAIMRAYFNTVSKAYRHVFSKAEDLFFVDESGKVSFNKSEAKRRFRYEDCRPFTAMRRLAARATKIIADFFSVRAAANSKAQAEKFAQLTSGKSNSGLGGMDFLKIAVQLLDPSQVYAAYTVDSNNKKTGRNHFEANLFNAENIESGIIKEVQDAENRFAEPSTLTD